MLSFTYSTQGTSCHGSLYQAKRVGDVVVVTVNQQEEENRIFITDNILLKDLQVIIEKHKMYKYKGHYNSILNILDGDSWSLEVVYQDDKMYIKASGTNAGPHNYGAAFREITDYFANR